MPKLIRFHGALADRYPEGILIEGDSAAECIAGLQNFPGFRLDEGVSHSVFLPDFQSRDAIYSRTEREIIEVYPHLSGAGGKTGMYLQIIIGVVLIATGWGAGLGGSVLGGAMTGGTAMMAGAMMVLGGVTGLLMPQPKLDTTSSEDTRSNYLNANKNTVKIGTRIPLIFGRRKVYGHYLSFNVSATNLNTPAPAAANEVGNAITYQAEEYAITPVFPIYEGGV